MPETRRSTLAGVGRLTLLAASLLGTVVLAIVWWRPQWVDAAGDALRHRIEQRYLARWERALALAGTDVGAASIWLGEMGRDLVHVRKQDRLAQLVRLVERFQIDLATKRGDRPRAVASARRLVDLDDRDVPAIGTLGRLLGEDPATRSEAIAVLTAMARRLPRDPVLIVPLTNALVADGVADTAARILLRAGNEAPSNVWRVAWGNDPLQETWFMPVRRRASGIEARFTIAEPVAGLRLDLPPFRALALRELTLAVATSVGAWTRPVASLRPRLTGLSCNGDALVAEADGEASIWLADLVLREGPAEFVLTAEAEDRLPLWLRQLALGAIGAAIAGSRRLDPETAIALDRLRAAAFGQCAMMAAWTAAGGGPAPGQRVAADLRVSAGTGACEFVASWRLPASAVQLRIELPSEAHGEYGLDSLQCVETVADGMAAEEPLPLGVIQLADIVSEGPVLRVTGPSPCLSLDLPGGQAERALTLRGRFR